MIESRRTEKLTDFYNMANQAGGPSWVVPLGRRDSRGASLSGSNNGIPAPNNTLPTIITKFKRVGLDIVDVVTLSGKLLDFFYP